ncbi:putative zinc-binding protein [Trypanosoma theileri]|uniref:Palmitoyltransferase n=1 Tax=Trypanosoma theileri TaxID=67003 RepID=A0A1X0NNR1_9TRYP|nr:putative zinc-binding protein [Trypanosoma theileri]ORC86143.1 putative zinc-binding protein [Trypanosoma theileri]
MVLFSYCLLNFVNPGVVPSWLAEKPMEDFIRAVLRNIIRQGGDTTNITNTNITNTNITAIHTENHNNNDGTVLSTNTNTTTTANTNTNTNGMGTAFYYQPSPMEEVVNASVDHTENINRETMEEQEIIRNPHIEENDKNVNKIPEVTEVSIHTNVLTHQPQLQSEEQEVQAQEPEEVNSSHDHRWAFQNTSTPLWMPHRNIAIVASDILAALDRSPESFEREMSFLLGGAKRCRFCRVYKLSETHHCSRCNMCIYHMDHHCVWLSRCIGYSNHKYFILFIGYLSLALGSVPVQFLVCSSQERCYINSPFDNDLFFFIIIIFTSFFSLALFVFFLENLWLLSRGDSTLRVIQEEERQRIQTTRPLETGYAYIPGELEDNVDVYGEAASRSCSLRNMQIVFGVGPVFPAWFLPVPPERLPFRSQETAFWSRQRVLVEGQLRSVVENMDREDGEEEGESK